MSSTDQASQNATVLIERLISALEKEQEMVARLHTQLTRQLENISDRSPANIEETAMDLNETNQELLRRRSERQRKLRLVRDVYDIDPGGDISTRVIECLRNAAGESDVAQRLEDAVVRIKDTAVEAANACDELVFSLSYASELGQEMLRMLGTHSSTSGGGYSASGAAETGPDQSNLVNQIG